MAEEMRELSRLEEDQDKRTQSKVRKRSIKQSAGKRGGLRPESPFFDED